MSTEKKLSTDNIRRMALAMQNAAEWQAKFYAGIVEEIDGAGTTATEPAPAKGKGKGKAAPVEVEEEMETVPSKFKKTEPEAEEDDMFGDDVVEEDAGPSLDDVRKVVKDFATKHGKEKALKLLGKFKVTAIPDIKKADYAKVIELAKKHL